MARRFRLRVAAVALVCLAAGTAIARAGDDAPAPPPPPTAADVMKDACMACHGDPAKAPRHQVFASSFALSVHGSRKMACGECHFDYDAHPHSKEAKTVGCAECHEDQAKVVAKSAHGRAPAPGAAESRAAACADCHGVHDARKPSDPASTLYPLNVPATCGRCHAADPFRGSGPANGNGDGASRPPSVGHFTDDTHSRALLKSGLVVAPTCVTCHGGHAVAHASDPASPVHHANVSETCGKCHVGIVQRYRESVHGKTPRDATKTVNHREPATCTDCHRPHGIRQVGKGMKLQVIETCSECHADRGHTYRGTYHGRVTDLGYDQGIASCDECHTPHSILPTSDPKSSTNPANRTHTCAKCHEGATDRFATYAVHANPADRTAWPVLWWAQHIMTTLIVVTWCLAGLHILLWFQRAVRERKSAEAALAHHPGGRWFERWSPFYRALHMTVAVTFLLLALTGLPLRFHEAPWSGSVYALLGGPSAARFLHRVGGAVTFLYFAVYLVHLVRRLRRGEKGLFRGPATLLPRWKDAQDVRANFRWFLRGGERPRFDRWTYWEKFDFWAEVWGVGFIGLTGLVMWFPIAATSVLPGSMINLAHMLHSYEALLATGFIFSVHFFHANLRPGKFPMDPIIFTGRIPEAEFKLEHRAEYDRLRAAGLLDAAALPPPDAALVRRAYVVGGTLLTIGLLLLLMMLSTLFV